MGYSLTRPIKLCMEKQTGPSTNNNDTVFIGKWSFDIVKAGRKHTFTRMARSAHTEREVIV